ncbi:uncharacterized protein N7446_007131 [Penicillium canescens]|uniref:uncharacterized protein n=1 Tax=Penicillium canescens TaxID=5083 RepID=UPI0026E03FAB|nr:uncharacterized protein N7446_007131 [Penicillium canescens]KAJ6063011.1 hypothetical protein N7446_007131 [Penicillium canescens]
MDIYARIQSCHPHGSNDIPLLFQFKTYLTPSTLSNNDSYSLRHKSKLVLVKWNIDLGAPKDQERATVTTTFITELEPKVDIVFLQDVSKGSCGKFYSTIVTVIRVFRANVMMGEGVHALSAQ